MNDYYVYIYYRLDTNEPFYVGMGHNDRWKDKWNRNKHFKNIINKYPIAVEIIKDNLTEEQAHGIECWLIHELVFEYGYSIDIKNNRSNEKGCHLVNATWGGEGVSGVNSWDGMSEDARKERCKKMSEKMSGENHPMYGIRGENHPCYGTHHTEESKQKNRESHLGKMCGENNPMYGVHRYGKDNPCATSVICITTKRIFLTVKEGAREYKCDNSDIKNCCRGYRIVKGKKHKRNYCGKLPDGTPLVWRYINYKHNKILRPIGNKIKRVA